MDLDSLEPSYSSGRRLSNRALEQNARRLPIITTMIRSANEAVTSTARAVAAITNEPKKVWTMKKLGYRKLFPGEIRKRSKGGREYERKRAQYLKWKSIDTRKLNKKYNRKLKQDPGLRAKENWLMQRKSIYDPKHPDYYKPRPKYRTRADDIYGPRYQKQEEARMEEEALIPDPGPLPNLTIVPYEPFEEPDLIMDLDYSDFEGNRIKPHVLNDIHERYNEQVRGLKRAHDHQLALWTPGTKRNSWAIDDDVDRRTELEKEEEARETGKIFKRSID